MKYRVLQNRVNRLWAERSAAVQYSFTLTTGETVKLPDNHSIIVGFQDFLDGIRSSTGPRSYEGYVFANAVSSPSAFATRWLSLREALLHPIDTDQKQRGE
jgi:hypothetical protein